MPTETRTVHFTIGENAGALLMQIAQEHLIYNGNPKKALETITQSLMGVPHHMAIKILRGDLVLPVDVERQEFLVGPYDESIHKGVFPRLDIKDFVMRKLREITETGKGLPNAIGNMQRHMRYRGTLDVSFDYSHILDFIGGDTAAVLRDIQENEEVEALDMLVRVSKAFLEKAAQDLAVIHFMKATWPEAFEEFKDDLDYRIYTDGSKEWIEKVGYELADLFRGDYMRTVKFEKPAEKFIEATLEIDKVIKAGIEPVDILDNYSAGWLAPDGTYYGLNGEIANMLHNQIASALYDKGGIIPESDENSTNPDGWLMENGWTRIHGDNILFEGYYPKKYPQLGRKCFPMTPAQIEAIYKYAQNCHGGALKLGLFEGRISAAMFQMLMESESPQIWEKYLV